MPGIIMVLQFFFFCQIIVGEAKRSLRCASSLFMVLSFVFAIFARGQIVYPCTCGSLCVRVENCISLDVIDNAMYECFKDCRFEFIFV
jgi:hypothetical protein